MFRNICLAVGLFLCAATAHAADVYVAQANAGAASGLNCANAKAVAGVTWTAGNAYHLCGTFTSPVTVGASGTSGAHISVLGEAGSNITMNTIPNSGGLVLTNRSFVDVDGQHNLVIQGVTNGTSSGRVNSVGVETTGHDLTVHGLTVKSLYLYTCCGSDSGGIGVYAIGDGLANIHVYDMIFQAEFAGVEMQVGAGGSNLEFDHITIPTPDVAWGIVPVEGFGNSFLNGLKIHDNDLLAGSGVTPGSGSSWCTGTTDFNHLDPIHTWSQGNAGGIINEEIYNNYIHGNFCVVGGTANSTAMIFWEAGVDGGSAPNTAIVHDNLLLMQGGHPGDGAIYKQTSTAGNIYNNTIDCQGADTSAIGMEMGAGGAATIKNNIVANCRNNGYLIDGSAPTASNNLGFNNGGTNNVGTAGLTSNPNFTATHALNIGSPAIGAALNLTSLGDALLDTGKPLLVGQGNVGQVGTARPSVGTWDIGAYPSNTTPVPGTSFAPTSLALGTQVIGTTSATLTSTLTNTGGATLNISSIVLGGTNPLDYALTTSCGATLTAGANCAIHVSFTPTTTGSRPAQVTVTDDASGSPQAVSLTGTGATAIPLPQPHQSVISGSLNGGQVGVAYSGRLSVQGDTPPDVWSVNPMVPGLSFDTTTGVLSGTPAQSGTFPLTFTVTDSFPCDSADTSCLNTSAGYTTNLAIQPAPTPISTYKLSVTPASLSLTASTALITGSINLDDSTPKFALPISVTSDQAWCQGVLAKPTTATTLKVTANPSGLAAGTYACNLTITAGLETNGDTVNNSPFVIPVKLVVTTPAVPLSEALSCTSLASQTVSCTISTTGVTSVTVTSVGKNSAGKTVTKSVTTNVLP